MATVAEHYANHLAPLYAWMTGGLEAAIERGNAEIDGLSLLPAGRGCAIDLGAGFGMHAIPLARRGFAVLAIDNSTELLQLLEGASRGLPVTAVNDDLLNFRQHLEQPVELVLCMGDTLTHLPTIAVVQKLIAMVSSTLCHGGQFVLTFRDYSSELEGNQRFIPVRSDKNRILTCFVEFAEYHVTVHDILHEREGDDWRLRVSSYNKLRFSPIWLERELRAAGFGVEVDDTTTGMVRMVARRSL